MGELPEADIADNQDFDQRVQQTKQVSALRQISATLRQKLQTVTEQQRNAGFSWPTVLRHFGRANPSHLNMEEFIAIFRHVAKIPARDVPTADLQRLFHAISGGGSDHAAITHGVFMTWLEDRSP